VTSIREVSDAEMRNRVLHEKDIHHFDQELPLNSLPEENGGWEGDPTDPMVKTIREDSDEEDETYSDLNILDMSSGVATVEVHVVNSPNGSVE